MEESANPERSCTDLPPIDYNLSFAGCGFLCMYYVGVMSCIQKFAPQLYLDRPVSGCSAGSIGAAFLICDVDIASWTEYLMWMINKSRKYPLGTLNPFYDISEYLRQGLDRFLPSNAHDLCTNRLFISMTHKSSGKNLIVSRFNSRNDLIDALLCSSFIPLFGGFATPKYQDDHFIDGALSDNLPGINKSTITISPFCGDADICPRGDIWNPGELSSVAGHICLSQTSIILNWTNLKRFVHIFRPMNPKNLAQLASDGYDDTLRYLLFRGLITCNVHHGRQSLSTAQDAKICHFYNLNSTSSEPNKVEASIDRQYASPDAHPNLTSALTKSKEPEMVKSPSRILLHTITNPVLSDFYSTSFGRRSQVVSDCIDCQNVILNSYASGLPPRLLALINGQEEIKMDIKEQYSDDRSLLSLMKIFNPFSSYQSLSPTSLACRALARMLELFVSSALLHVSAAQSLTLKCVRLIRWLPSSISSRLEPITKLLVSFAKELTIVLENGANRTENLATVLRSNRSLDETFTAISNMIRCELSSAIPSVVISPF